MKAAREAWFDGQPDLAPERLIFIDETGLSTKMARLRGRCPKGERLFASIPHGHWRTTTFVAGLRLGAGRADGTRRSDERRGFPRLCRAGARRRRSGPATSS